MAEPVHLRVQAASDIDDAVEYYQREAGAVVAGRFIDAVERTLTRVGRNPRAGALRYAYDLGIPELRFVVLARFPYVVFYRETSDVIDVWRVLHTRRDLPAVLASP